VSETDIILGLNASYQVSKINAAKTQKKKGTCNQTPGKPTDPRLRGYGVTLYPPVAGSHIAVIAIICELV
jgi:hypothetical protein